MACKRERSTTWAVHPPTWPGSPQPSGEIQDRMQTIKCDLCYIWSRTRLREHLVTGVTICWLADNKSCRPDWPQTAMGARGTPEPFWWAGAPPGNTHMPGRLHDDGSDQARPPSSLQNATSWLVVQLQSPPQFHKGKGFSTEELGVAARPSGCQPPMPILGGKGSCKGSCK